MASETPTVERRLTRVEQAAAEAEERKRARKSELVQLKELHKQEIADLRGRQAAELRLAVERGRSVDRLQKQHIYELAELRARHREQVTELRKSHRSADAAQARKQKRRREWLFSSKLGRDLYAWKVQGDGRAADRLMKNEWIRVVRASARRARAAAAAIAPYVASLSPHVARWWERRKARHQLEVPAANAPMTHRFAHNLRRGRNLALGLVGFGAIFALAVPALWAASPALGVAAAVGASAALARYPISQLGHRSSAGIHHGGRLLGRVIAAEYDKQYRLRSDGVRQRYRVRVDDAAKQQS